MHGFLILFWNFQEGRILGEEDLPGCGGQEEEVLNCSWDIPRHGSWSEITHPHPWSAVLRNRAENTMKKKKTMLVEGPITA